MVSVQSGQYSVKRSRTSAQAGTTRQSQSNMTSVALHAVDSSIRHLSDSIASSLLDPYVTVRDATQMLYSQATMPQHHRHFMISHFSRNPVTAVTFTSLPDDNTRLLFVGDLYDEYGPSAAGPSATGPSAAGTSAFGGV
jgi:hypothetical protein